MKVIYKVLSLLAITTLGISCTAEFQRTTSLDRGWLFTLEGDGQSQTVNLPHDWSILGHISPENAMGDPGGYFPDGKGTYVKTLKLNAEQAGKHITLYFEGSYMSTEVYVNGTLAGTHAYGYTSFFTDISGLVHEGDNEISVHVDNSQQLNCRWYSGSGLYRHVDMIMTDDVHFENWGTQIIADARGHVSITTEIVNEGDEDVDVEISATAGQETGKTVRIPAGAREKAELELTVASPKLWSPDEPNMYEAVLTLTASDGSEDRLDETFGFRSIAYNSDEGFLLNGKPLKVWGGCIHHDNGILGAAAFDRAEERKVEMMKEGGFNAVRTSHNPPSEAFLDACDRLGLMVIDEAFDGWYEAKNPYDYSTLIDEHWREDISAMVLRDRNHPSIICWSIGNEILERKSPEAVTTAAKLSGLCRELDGTRPVTEALASWDRDWEIFDPLAAQHEIVGYNYMIHKAAGDHERLPERVIWQTESYPRNAFRNWKLVNYNSYIIGDFVWTAIDYLGESSIGRWYYREDKTIPPGEHYTADPKYPWHGAYCGDIDLTGWRKPVSHYRELLYSPETVDTPYLAVREPDGYHGKIRVTGWGVWPTWESWNWPGWEGKDIDVEVYARSGIVSLYLNDELLGEKEVSEETEFKAVFAVPYAPGKLKAVLSEKGSTRETVLATAGEPYALRVTADRNILTADGQDLSFVTIEVVDSEGNICPDAEIPLNCSIKGNALILAAFGNADLTDEDPYSDAAHGTWKGRAMAVVRAGYNGGSAKVTFSADGLKSDNVRIKVR